MTKTPILLATQSAWRLAQRVSELTRWPAQVVETRVFEDGEMKARPFAEVTGHEVFLVQDLHSDKNMSVHDRLLEAMIVAGAARDAGAKRLCLVSPYLCYSRQDRRTEAGGALTSRYLAELLEAAGIDQVLTVDVHNPSAFDNSFRVQVSHLSAVELFANELNDELSGLVGKSPLTLVSPDIGAIKRCEALRDCLLARGRKNIDMAYVIKKRRNGVESEDLLFGHLEGRTVVIFDDIISTGATIALAATTCWKRGASEIVVLATHGLFVADAVQVLSELRLKQIVVTNSVPSQAVKSGRLSSLIRVLDLSEVVAKELMRIAQTN